LFLELFVCGVFKKFPFTGERVTLYFAPFVFFYIVQGFGFLRRNRVIYNALIGCFCLFLLLCAGNTVVSFLGLYR
ncbi:MAG: hypothetical protein KKC84_04175, partial [Candidatus Omnitrophica bacterium]|nr:hypothetical protein [Candidatus Omnitrophota bacterium]